MRSPPRAPIVLAHGLAAFSRFAVRRLRDATYFRGIPKDLRARGCRVIVTEVPPLGSLAQRAAALKDEIRDAVGREPVHVIAHSMGGLDARHMISRLGMEKQVLTLVTIGTPHRGSPVADRVHELAARFGVIDALNRVGFDHGGLDDLRTDACARWNERTPDAPDVRYFSIAGVKRRDEMLYALRLTHDLISPIDGANDGLVSRRSAAWGEPLPAWDCDHFNLIGWTFPRTQALGHARDVRPRFGRIARRLADLELR